MPTDPNDIPALARNLANAYGKVIVHGVKVRIENGEMIVSHKDQTIVTARPDGTIMDAQANTPDDD